MDSLTAFAKIGDSISESASIMAVFPRRKEEWEHQKVLATQDGKHMDKQVLASEIRVVIATKELEIHDKNVEQAKLDEFYKNMFTNLGLYNYLSTSMFRSYSQSISKRTCIIILRDDS